MLDWRQGGRRSLGSRRHPHVGGGLTAGLGQCALARLSERMASRLALIGVRSAHRLVSMQAGLVSRATCRARVRCQPPWRGRPHAVGPTVGGRRVLSLTRPALERGPRSYRAATGTHTLTRTHVPWQKRGGKRKYRGASPPLHVGREERRLRVLRWGSAPLLRRNIHPDHITTRKRGEVARRSRGQSRRAPQRLAQGVPLPLPRNRGLQPPWESGDEDLLHGEVRKG